MPSTEELLRDKRNELTAQVDALRAELAPWEERWGELRNGAPETSPGERGAVRGKLQTLRAKLFPLLKEQGAVAQSLPEGKSFSKAGV